MKENGMQPEHIETATRATVATASSYAVSLIPTMIPLEVAITIDHQVNASIAPLMDAREEWRDDTPAQGDCDDYALSKRRQLLMAGYSHDDLRLLVLRDGGLHIVLLVRTEQGWVALDNLRSPYSAPAGLLIQIGSKWHNVRTRDGKPGSVQPAPEGWSAYCAKKINLDKDCVKAAY